MQWKSPEILYDLELLKMFFFYYSRLKKEHEVVRQETVQVILGEQKLQVEHRLLKNELDELSKVRGQGHFMLESFRDWYYIQQS